GVGGTFTGNPVACAAALKVIEVIESKDFAERAITVGERVAQRFRRFHEQIPLVGEVRGLGSMQALELVQDRETRIPSPEAAATIVQYAYEHGLIISRTGSLGNVIRFLAPLSITDMELEEGLDILEAALVATPVAA